MKKTNRSIARRVSGLLGLSLLVNIAISLTVENISLERMTRESHTIIRGSILSSYSQWEEGAIFTYTTVRVKEGLKGDRSATITVKQMGGQVGDIGQEVDGTPKLLRNEEVVLFLTQWKNQYWIHSIVLGKFTVIDEDGRAVAYNDLNNIGLVDPVTRQEISQPNKKLNHIPLQNFLSEVRSFINK